METFPNSSSWESGVQDYINVLRAETALLMAGEHVHKSQKHAEGSHVITALNNDILAVLPKERSKVLIRSAHEVEMVDGQFQDADAIDIHIIVNTDVELPHDREPDNVAELVLCNDYRLRGAMATLDVGTVFLDTERRPIPGSFGLILDTTSGSLCVNQAKLNKTDPYFDNKANIWMAAADGPRHSLYVSRKMLDIVRRIRSIQSSND